MPKIVLQERGKLKHGLRLECHVNIINIKSSELTVGLGMQRLAMGSGLLYVGEYRPAKQLPVEVIGPWSPVGPLGPIILSGEYITNNSSH